MTITEESTKEPPVPPSSEFDVLTIGMGYVGTTLTAAMLASGYRVIGCEQRPEAAKALAKGEMPFDEPRVDELLAAHIGRELRIVSDLGDVKRCPPVVIVCVGTPTMPGSDRPDLSQLRSAVEAIAPLISSGTLVVIRSTVPIGTNAGLVSDILRRHVDEPLIASCPERTIQGIALDESRRLPQIVGGSSLEARRRAVEFFSRIAVRVVPVSSPAAAEAIKLICNCHTDVIYGFGNEVAQLAEHAGLDALELIESANIDYPRPDLHRPGYVGGSCLTKDPYLLAASLADSGYVPRLILAARHLNEDTPRSSARRVLETLRRSGLDLSEITVVVSGLAYKGVPATDDVRGSGAFDVIALLRDGGIGRILGHDFVLSPERIAATGLSPVDLESGARGAHVIMLLNNHRSYGDVDFALIEAVMAEPKLIYDAWGVTGSVPTNLMRLGRA